MTVMETEEVSKVAHVLGDIPGTHPDVHDLPVGILDGTGDHEGDLDVAGKAAAEVYNNWDDDTWRNSFLMGLAQHIENQVTHHRAELQELVNSAHNTVHKSARRSIVKAYISDVLNEMVAKADTHVRPYHRADGTLVSGYDREQAASMATALLMAQRSSRPNASQAALFTIRDSKTGKVRNEQPDAGQGPKLKKNERIIRINNLGENLIQSPGGDAYNVASMLGANSAQAGAAGNVARELSRQGRVKYNDDGSTNWFGRLESASETLHHATNNDRVRVAAATGKMVGKYGPETTRVVGPHMRRLGYKYRGDAAPAAQWTSVARAGRQVDSKGDKESIDALQHKLALSLQMDRAHGGVDAIPTEEQAELLLKTGSTAPSHGYILDHQGNVRQQAKGVADDHYVPFNIKDFHHLNRGSYVRSRVFGGPTTDDFAASLKTGAKSFTTVSRTGIYKVEFTPQTDKAGKKIGVWAKDTAGDGNQAIINRYGRLLDAVKHGKVKDPETGENTILNGHGYALALQSLQKQYPYQIKSVSYTPIRDTGSSGEGGRASHLKEDSGYIRPYYLKPGEAVQGYYDQKLGGNRSFDELDAYRLGRARYWAAKQRDETVNAQRRQAEIEARARGGNIPLGRRDGAPSNASPQQQRIFNSGVGDYGATVKATPATRGAEGENGYPVWSEPETHAFLAHVSALLDHVGPADSSMASLQARLNTSGEDFDDFVDAVRYNRGNIREGLHEDLDELSKHMDMGDSTGLGIYRKALKVGADNDLANEPAPAGFKEDPAILAGSPEYREYEQWRKLFHSSGSLQQQRKNPNANQERIRELERERDSVNGMRLNDVWDAPDPNTDGLTRWQAMQNRMARARGEKPPHQPSDNVIAEPERSATAVTPDMDSAEAEAQAQRYMEQQMRELDQGDEDGYGHGDRDVW